MYQSPFRIIDADALPPDGAALKQALALEKKKLLAEFELTGRATIDIDGRELHRQDALSLFEELSNADRLRFHLAIWQDTGLLQFLESGLLPAGQSWIRHEVYREPQFLAFVSPYFAIACDAFMRRALAGAASAAELQALHGATALLLPADTETAYRYVTRFFTEKKNELLALRHRADSGTAVSFAELAGWCTDDQIHLLNRLPDTFTSLRYTLANSLNNLCVAYDRRKINRHALAAIERAAAIRVEDEELGQLIPVNLRIVRSKQSRTWYNTDPATGRKMPGIGFIILLFVIIIRVLSAGDGCGGHSGNGAGVKYDPAQSATPEEGAGTRLAITRPVEADVRLWLDSLIWDNANLQMPTTVSGYRYVDAATLLNYAAADTIHLSGLWQ